MTGRGPFLANRSPRPTPRPPPRLSASTIAPTPGAKSSGPHKPSDTPASSCTPQRPTPLKAPTLSFDTPASSYASDAIHLVRCPFGAPGPSAAIRRPPIVLPGALESVALPVARVGEVEDVGEPDALAGPPDGRMHGAQVTMDDGSGGAEGVAASGP